MPPPRASASPPGTVCGSDGRRACEVSRWRCRCCHRGRRGRWSSSPARVGRVVLSSVACVVCPSAWAHVCSPSRSGSGFCSGRGRRTSHLHSRGSRSAPGRAYRCWRRRTPCSSSAPGRAGRCWRPHTPCTCSAAGRAGRFRRPRTRCTGSAAAYQYVWNLHKPATNRARAPTAPEA